MPRRRAGKGKPKKRLRQTFILQWREARGLTQTQLAERVGESLGREISYVSIGRIERGEQPYNQRTLEALADALGTEPASLLIRKPGEGEMWSIWDRAEEGQRRMIEDIARTVIGKTGTGG